MQKNKEIFETMPVGRALATLAVPSIISQLITMIYNLADTFFIGMTNDPYKVAAASLSFVLVFVMNALSNLFGIGGGSLISRLLGKKQDVEAKKVCSFSFYGAFALAGLYALFSLILREPLLRFVGASDNTIGYASDYMIYTVTIGAIPTMLSVTMAHLLRSEGYAGKASFGLGFGGVLNMILDPLFMFVILPEGNEVSGAAIATLISNTSVLIYFIITFMKLRGKTVLSIAPKFITSGAKYIGQICAVGFPSAVSSALASISNMTINRLIVGYGDIPLAAMGIVKKIDMLPLNVGMGLCQGMMPLVAYNYAAKNYERMRAFTRAARNAGIIFALVCVISFEIFAGQIVGLFIEEPETLRLGTNFLRICCLFTPIMVCNFQMNYTFQAMGKGKHSLLLAASRQGLVNIPLLFIMNYLFGMYGVTWTQIISDTITLIIGMTLYHNLYKKLTVEENKQ